MENNNKKEIYIKFNKKVVAVSFLALALFMLFAVSYAYFTATVEGNEDAKKVTVTTGEMKLKLTGPELVTAENLLPGQKTSIKFTVENTGTVPAVYNLDMIEVKNDFDPKSDLVYSVESTNGGGNVKNIVAPSQNQTLIRNISIQPGPDNIQNYTLNIEFKETNVNQNSNQGKTFEGKVQINYLEDNSLVTTIFKSNEIKSADEIDFNNGSPKCESSSSCNNPTDNGSGLYTTEDNEGTSYYFRGDKTKINNNVRFAGQNWKILRINGDGSIRLVYSDTGNPSNSPFNDSHYDQDYPKYVGYTFDNEHACTSNNPCESDYQENDFKTNYGDKASRDSVIKGVLENWYEKSLASYDSKIALTTYCNDTSYGNGSDDGNTEYLYFGVSKRLGISLGEENLSSPSLKCPDPTNNVGAPKSYGGVYKLKIGLLTADEMNMAGFNLANGYPESSNNYLYNDKFNFWTMTPYYYHYSSGPIMILKYDSGISTSPASFDEAVVPVINLKPDTPFNSGTGTESDPYIIS